VVFGKGCALSVRERGVSDSCALVKSTGSKVAFVESKQEIPVSLVPLVLFPTRSPGSQHRLLRRTTASLPASPIAMPTPSPRQPPPLFSCKTLTRHQDDAVPGDLQIFLLRTRLRMKPVNGR